MTSHLGFMLLFAACVAAVFGALLRDDPREQLRLGGRVFALLVGAAWGLGWIMFAVFS